jgi:hypothetical protein
MPVVWNSENTMKLLLMIIQNHYAGTPDYERLAREWGPEVSATSLKTQFYRIRGRNKNGRITKGTSPPVKKQDVKVKKEDMGESE